MNHGFDFLNREWFVDYFYTEEEKKFAMKLYKNDCEYIYLNYKNILKKDTMNDCFMIAVSFCDSVGIIKFIINKFNINKNYINKRGNNCLMSACMFNNNLLIIKYLIEDLEININYINEYFDPMGGIKNHFKDNCLTIGCRYNPNLAIIKYLIEDVKMNTNHVNYWKNNCFVLACENNEVEIVKYLIEETDVILSIKTMSLALFKSISCDLKNYHRLNTILKLGYDKYDIISWHGTISLINSLFLDKNILELANISDPYDDNFDLFIKKINNITRSLPIEIEVNKKSKKLKTQDFSVIQKSETLFEHNSICYFGDRNIVYNSMFILKGIILDDCFDFKDNIVLNVIGQVPVPEYIINLYIEACYNKIFDIYNIEADDLIIFLKFIDQYPSNIISIDQLENDLIDFLHKNLIIPCDYILSTCKKYQLKRLYVFIHNKKV